MADDRAEDGRIDASGIRLTRDPWGRLVLTAPDGREFTGVVPVRAFPLSDAVHGLSIVDAGGRELVWADTPDELPAPARQVLAEELARREFLPVVFRVRSISAPVEPSEWEVETDRGPTLFVVNNEDDVRRLTDHRAMVIDAHGTRYLIPDVRTLDAHSRRLLERFL